MKTTVVLMSTLAIVAAIQPAAYANLITNGGFENPTGCSSVCGFVVPTDWASNGNIDIVGSSFWSVAEGTQSVDLNGADAGTLSQTFATTIGATYTVTFDLAGNPFNGPAIKTLTVSAAGQSQAFSFDTTGHNGTNMGWTPETFAFVANNTTATLLFSSTTFGSNAGPALDNVTAELTASPSPVPEPSSLSLAATVVLGLLARRRFRRADTQP